MTNDTHGALADHVFEQHVRKRLIRLSDTVHSGNKKARDIAQLLVEVSPSDSNSIFRGVVEFMIAEVYE